jgi:hypothetical protein
MIGIFGVGWGDWNVLIDLVPAVPKIGRAVWTVGEGLETAGEEVPFEVHEFVEFAKTGVWGIIGVVTGDGMGFA